MKKYISILLAAVLCFSLSTNAHAVSNDDSTTNEPILDYNFLSSADITEVDGNVVITRDTPMYPQGRSNISSRIQETVILVPSANSSTKNILSNIDTLLLARSSGNKYEEEFDSTLSVKIYTTLYYDRKTENNTSYVLLTKVTGGTNFYDSHVTLVNQLVRYGCDGRLSPFQEVTQRPTANPWSYTTPSSWNYVSEAENITTIGAYYEVELTRGNPNSSWIHGLSNFLVLNFDLRK